MYYALVKDGKVINTVVWDGENEVEWGEGVVAYKIPENQAVGIGYLYSEGKFTLPPLSDEEQEEAIQKAVELNLTTKEQLIANATQSIVVFQTKLLMGRKLTTAEMALLNGRMDYIDLLSAIDANTAEPIDWPALPA